MRKVYQEFQMAGRRSSSDSTGESQAEEGARTMLFFLGRGK